MKARIAIDARMLGSTGIGTYLKGLLQNFAILEHEFHFEIIGRNRELLDGLPANRFTFIPARADIYSAAEHWEIAGLASGADLLHCPHYNAPFFFRGPLVVTVHDLTHLVFPPSRAAWLYARWVMASACRRARKIITDSHFSKLSIEQQFHVPQGKTRVIYVGLPKSPHDPVPTVPTRLCEMGIMMPYVLFVGLLKPHKNVSGLIRAYAQLPRELAGRFQLVIAGKKDQSYPELEGLARDLSLDGRVVFTGYVSEADLDLLYSGASLFVLPSFNEGFGLPALEAMAHGVPVVASNRASLPEVVGEAALMVDPVQPDALSAAMARLLTDSALRADLVCRGRDQAKLFSAREAAQQHLEVYREALSHPGVCEGIGHTSPPPG